MNNNTITATAETKMKALAKCAAKVTKAGHTLTTNWHEICWEWDTCCKVCTATYYV